MVGGGWKSTAPETKETNSNPRPSPLFTTRAPRNRFTYDVLHAGLDIKKLKSGFRSLFKEFDEQTHNLNMSATQCEKNS